MSKTVGKVQVGQLQYSIIEEGNGENVYDDSETGARIGLCCYFDEKIIIHKGMSKMRKRMALAHELCHAYLQATASIRDSWSHEDVCDVMESFADPIMRAVNRIYPLGKESE